MGFQLEFFSFLIEFQKSLICLFKVGLSKFRGVYFRVK